MKIIKGGVTKPYGFKSSGVAAGIKKSGKLDLGLIYSETPATTAAVFTKNSVKAAPIIVTQKHVQNNRAQAIVVNSGNANCFTGKFGLVYVQKTTEIIAKLLNINRSDVLVASTGIIGKPLPYQKIEDAAPLLVKNLSVKGAKNIARAILTTDKTTKECTVQIKIGGKKVTIGSCAKGSGMIAPNMATMLAFITTDAAINGRLLKLALKEAVDESFNSITVDGSMSTNDMVSVMANGWAKNKTITQASKDFFEFSHALNYVCLDLAKKIVLDGEGATKFIEIQVMGAKDNKQAKAIALKIANCNLVKTAAYGSNPNWGRVSAAIGALGISKLTEHNLKIAFSSFAKKQINITINLNIGLGKATVYTCDLSVEYIKINAAYN